MTVHDLLLALLLPSADDAAQDLADNVGGGSVAHFIALMNDRARRLGLSHTHYSTPIGLDTPGNYSTAEDLARLAGYDLRTEPFLRRAVALASARLRSGRVPRRIVNRNDLVGRFPWIDGVKTGHTLQAGYVLVGAGARDGLRLISVVLGTPSPAQRDATTLTLLRYGFSAFALRTPVLAGQPIAEVGVRWRPRRRIAVAAGATYAHVFARPQRITTRAHLPRQLNGPLARGARVGALTVLADGRPVGSVPLVLVAALAHFSPPGVSVARLAIPITLLSAVLLAGAVAVAARFARQGRRARAAGGRRGR